MIKLYIILITFIFGLLSFSAFAQNTDKCTLSADELVSLVNTNNDVIEDALMHHCFRVDNAGIDKGIRKAYRRYYNSNADFDIVNVHDDGAIGLQTTSAENYILYKDELKGKGFKFTGDDKTSGDSIYENEKYHFRTWNTKSRSGVIIYHIMILEN